MSDTGTDITSPPPRANVGQMLAYQHELDMARATRPPREERPVFHAERATTSGALGVWKLQVTVPVCDEYPTTAEAFAAQCDFMERLSGRFPLPDGRPRATDALAADLKRSVKK